MNVRNRVLGMAAMALGALLGPALALAGGETARASLPQVLAKAKTWQDDAILVHLSSTKAEAAGTASEWKYSFYSPKTGKRCVVTSRQGAVTAKEVRLGNYTEPLGEFVDSDKAMAVAKKNGLKGGQPSMGVARPAGGKAGSTYWLVTGGWEKGDTIITIDARNGTFTRLSVMGVD